MPFYLGQWTGAGTRVDPCVPKGAIGAWSVIDLRADGGATPSGGGVNALLLHSPVAQLDPALKLLANAETDVLDLAGKTALASALGLASVTSLTFHDLLVDLLTNPPAGKWQAVAARLDTGMVEIFLGPVQISMAPPAPATLG